MAEPNNNIPSQQDPAAAFRDNNIQLALNLIRQLNVHCVLFLPATGPDAIPDVAAALIHRYLVQVAKLYEPSVMRREV